MTVARKSKQAVVSEFRCAEILGAARKVFARRGFDGATVEEIAEAAGLAKGTVYLYFPSKREIYLEALRQGISRLTAEMKRNVAAAPAPADKVRAFVETRVRYAEEHRDLVKIYHSEFGNFGAAQVNKECRSLYLEQIRMLEAVLEEAVASGHIRSLRAGAAAFTISEMIRGLILQRLFGWSRESVANDVEFLLEMIWKGLAGCTES
ncbi:MAG: TetR/AcrR family transcriptional regulator [Bryobacteraceae bacterium]|jgi:AcrR family transcriptional regulator